MLGCSPGFNEPDTSWSLNLNKKHTESCKSAGPFFETSIKTNTKQKCRVPPSRTIFQEEKEKNKRKKEKRQLGNLD